MRCAALGSRCWLGRAAKASVRSRAWHISHSSSSSSQIGLFSLIVWCVPHDDAACAQIGITSELISKGKYAEIFSARSFTAQEDAYFGRGAMAVSVISMY